MKEPLNREQRNEQARTLLAMHSGPNVLVLPNAWDAGSAKLFEREGFKAIATTSSGIELAEALSFDLRERREQMLSAIARIVRAVDVPVTADIESGLAEDLNGVTETVSRTIEAGAVGINLEDVVQGFEVAKRARRVPLQASLEQFVEWIRAARRASDTAGVRLVINARTDAFTLKKPNALEDAIRRGNAYLEAGADCVFVPYASDRANIAALVHGIKGPLNILGGPKTPSVSTLQELGVRRISVGGSISRAAMQLVSDAAKELREKGTFSYATGAMEYDEVVNVLDPKS